MASFKDQNGKTWSVTLDAPKIREVRRVCSLDLAAIDERPYERMYDDAVLLVDVLWILCREQAEKAGITDEQFGAALVGDAIDHATEAMLEAILDFSPSRNREVLRTLAAKTAKVRNVSIARAMDRLNDPTLEAQLLAAMDAKTEADIKSLLTRLSSATNTPE